MAKNDLVSTNVKLFGLMCTHTHRHMDPVSFQVEGEFTRSSSRLKSAKSGPCPFLTWKHAHTHAHMHTFIHIHYRQSKGLWAVISETVGVFAALSGAVFPYHDNIQSPASSWPVTYDTELGIERNRVHTLWDRVVHNPRSCSGLPPSRETSTKPVTSQLTQMIRASKRESSY